MLKDAKLMSWSDKLACPPLEGLLLFVTILHHYVVMKNLTKMNFEANLPA